MTDPRGAGGPGATGRCRGPRVVVASRIFAPEAAAASFRLWALTRALARGTGRVTVLTVRSGPGVTPAELAAVDQASSRVDVRRWPVLRDASGIVRGYLQYLSFDVPLAFRLVLSRRPDVVVSEPPPTTGAVVRAVCAVLRVPYVYYAADVWSDAAASTGAPRGVVRAVAALERWALRGARAVVAVSDGVAERLREMGVAEERITVVRNGVDIETFTPDGPRADGAPGEPYLVYAGTASEWQGAEIFVDALAIVRRTVPDARLVYLGQGSAWDILTERARAHAPGVVDLHGPVSPAQAAAWQRGAAGSLVSLRPGQGYDFAFPTKVFASVACGTPVLYAGPGPARRVIEDGGLGVVVDYDVEQVAAAMVDLLDTGRDGRADRARLAQWAVDNASAARAGELAANVVRRCFDGTGSPDASGRTVPDTTSRS